MRFWSWPKRPTVLIQKQSGSALVDKAFVDGSEQMKRRKWPAATFWAALLLGSLNWTTAAPSAASESNAALQELDRMAYAVEGAESSHGANPAMWRPNPAGPQGPMQVSEKAARDAGGGDRFNLAQNRAIGRAYLALLYRRYRNWPDAVSAYNWGMGNFDGWIGAGRPSSKLVPAVAVYSRRVLIQSGLCAPYGTRRDCTLAVSQAHAPYIHGFYRSPSAASVYSVVPGMETSGRPLAKLAVSGDPLPRLAESGDPLPGLERSGRPLSHLARNRQP